MKKPPWDRSKWILLKRVRLLDLERVIRRRFHERSTRTDILVVAIAEAVMSYLEGKE